MPRINNPESREFVAYKVTNAVTGKAYIGITCQGLARRLWEHRACARRRRSSLLWDAIREYGPASFTIEPLACALSMADRWELGRVLIAQWGTCGDGYNELPGVPKTVNDPGVPLCFTSQRPPMPQSRRLQVSQQFKGKKLPAELCARRAALRRGKSVAGKPVNFKGIDYPSIQAAAAAHGVTRSVVEWAIHTGRASFTRRAA